MWGEKDSNLRRRSPADLQSAAIDRSAISPTILHTYIISVMLTIQVAVAQISNPFFILHNTFIKSRRRDLNPRPADYKSAALPAELCGLI